MSAVAAPAGAARLRAGAAAAVAAALAYLEDAQLPSGEIPVDATTDPSMRQGRSRDPSVFPAALAVHSLSFAGEAARPIVERAADFLLAEMDAGGLWRHWTRAHPYHRQLPPDLDDTSCASAALVRIGRAIPDNRAILRGNRARDGMFLTWLLPRLRWTGLPHLRATLPRLRHPATLFLFFRRTSARAGDVDAVVNANVLHYLRAAEGVEGIADRLMRVLADDREGQADKWYDNPIIVRYFLSRALAGLRADAGDILVHKTGNTQPGNALEAALLACTLADWGRDIGSELVARLLDSQLPSGAWPAAAVYHGGRRRLPGGGFAPPHPDTPHWGSEELSTAFAVEALSRYLAPGT